MTLTKWWLLFGFLSCTGYNVDPYNYIVVQYRADGTPLNCWLVKRTSVFATEGRLSWRTPDGHGITLSGGYNLARVGNEDFASAADALGIRLEACVGGLYKLGEVDIGLPEIGR